MLRYIRYINNYKFDDKSRNLKNEYWYAIYISVCFFLLKIPACYKEFNRDKTKKHVHVKPFTAWFDVDSFIFLCMSKQMSHYCNSWTCLYGPVNPVGCISLSCFKETEMEPLLGERTVFWTLLNIFLPPYLVFTVEIHSKRSFWQSCSSINLLLVT